MTTAMTTDVQGSIDQVSSSGNVAVVAVEAEKKASISWAVGL